MGGGLSRVCKLYGRLRATDAQGRSVMWVWDYVADKAVLESEMKLGSARWKASEKAKWEAIQRQFTPAPAPATEE